VFNRQFQQTFHGVIGTLSASFQLTLDRRSFVTMSESRRPAPTARPSAGSTGTEDAQRAHTVLVVDDEAGARESLRLILEPRYRVLTAESGEAALGILERERISVMTLDLRMPGWGGPETLLRVRENERTLEVIIVSAYGSYSEAMRALRLKAFDLVAKPFRPALVLEAVERAIARCEEHRHGRPDALRGLQERLLDAVQGLSPTEMRRLSGGAQLNDVREQARTLVKHLTNAVTRPDDGGEDLGHEVT
jgi:DNA-binding response OmpR family regulator